MKHCDKLAVTVNPTNQCNLRCEYCMAASWCEQANPITISLEFAKQGIKDALMGIPTRIKARALRFFSPGEPTQQMAVLRECVEFARSINPGIETELQTNGLFKSSEDTIWIGRNFDVVWFSLDGPPSVNDTHRRDEENRGRTVEIEANLQEVAQSTAVGIRSTIVEETIMDQVSVVEYYHHFGIKSLAFNPVIRPIYRNADRNNEVTRVSIMKFAEGFLPAYNRAQELDIHLSSALTFNFDEPTNVVCRSCVPMPQLNPDGSVSSCDMALYHDTMESLRCFLYGSWDAETGIVHYDQERIANLRRRNLQNMPKCSGCNIAKFCAGGCAGRVAYQTGSIYDIIPEYCEATRYLAKHMELGQKRMLYTHP